MGDQSRSMSEKTQLAHILFCYSVQIDIFSNYCQRSLFSEGTNEYKR